MKKLLGILVVLSMLMVPALAHSTVKIGLGMGYINSAEESINFAGTVKADMKNDDLGIDFDYSIYREKRNQITTEDISSMELQVKLYTTEFYTFVSVRDDENMSLEIDELMLGAGLGFEFLKKIAIESGVYAKDDSTETDFSSITNATIALYDGAKLDLIVNLEYDVKLADFNDNQYTINPVIEYKVTDVVSLSLEYFKDYNHYATLKDTDRCFLKLNATYK